MNILKNKTICAIFTLSMVIIALTGCSDEDNAEQTGKQTLSELLIGKWDFVESQEKKDGKWTEMASDYEEMLEFRADGFMTVSYTYQGEKEEQEMKWTLDNATGEISASYGDKTSNVGTISFSENGNTMYLVYYHRTDEAGVVSTGEFRDVHLRVKSTN